MADTRDWPERLIELYDKLAGGGAEISCSFDQFEVKLPERGAAAGGGEQTLRLSGTIKLAARRGPAGGGSPAGGRP